MITEDYVNFETAKLLKEKGFDIPSFNPEEWPCCMYDEEGKLQWGCYSNKWYCRITLQMAMKWLREVYQIHIEIGFNEGYFPVCISTLTNDTIPYRAMQGKPFKYEEACEAAIKYCLENLI